MEKIYRIQENTREKEEYKCTKYVITLMIINIKVNSTSWIIVDWELGNISAYCTCGMGGIGWGNFGMICSYRCITMD